MTFAQFAASAVAILVSILLIRYGYRVLRYPDKVRFIPYPGTGPASILGGVVILWLLAEGVVVRATDYRMSINRWWFEPEGGGFWLGLLSPLMLTLFLAVCLLWWWPENPKQFLSDLRSRQGRRILLWDLGGSIVALVVAIATFAAGFFVIMNVGRMPDWLSGVLGIALIILVYAAVIGTGIGYTKVFPEPKRYDASEE